MPHLHQILAERVSKWRADGYPSPECPAIAEILEWAIDLESGTPRFLRLPQISALETYWYLRLVERTPHVFALYQRLFAEPAELLDALGLSHPEITKLTVGRPLDALWERIKTDDAFVQTFRLEGLRETLALGYPSWILALAMGAGQTILIGAICATEFAMALEYPERARVRPGEDHH
jgi:type III restriction enzyme